MKQWRYWFFYALLACGLVVSWGLMGGRMSTELSKGASALLVEFPCDPMTTPCAAYGKDAALVLQIFSVEDESADEETKNTGINGQIKLVTNREGAASPELSLHRRGFKYKAADNWEQVSVRPVNDLEWQFNLQEVSEKVLLLIRVDYTDQSYVAEFGVDPEA